MSKNVVTLKPGIGVTYKLTRLIRRLWLPTNCLYLWLSH